MEKNFELRIQKFHPFILVAVTVLGMGLLITHSAASPTTTATTTTETTTAASKHKSVTHAHNGTTTTTGPKTTGPTTPGPTTGPTTIMTTLMTTMNATAVTLPPTTPIPTKSIEPCEPKICEERICRVNGSISRPSFYARCPLPSENEPNSDLTKYCMCASAFHASATDENQQFYVQITPDTSCEVPETDEDKGHCEQRVCQGPSKKSDRTAHICHYEDKFYCGCFN